MRKGWADPGALMCTTQILRKLTVVNGGTWTNSYDTPRPQRSHFRKRFGAVDDAGLYNFIQIKRRDIAS